jgi:hypothetical protein
MIKINLIKLKKENKNKDTFIKVDSKKCLKIGKIPSKNNIHLILMSNIIK